MHDSKISLLESTIRLIAEEGLQGFSMKRVTQMAGTSETLIYRHYETKETLLLKCFQTVDRQIAAHFARRLLGGEDFTPDPRMAAVEEPELACRHFLMGTLRFLADLGDRTLYYGEYLSHRGSRGGALFTPSLHRERTMAFDLFSDALAQASGIDPEEEPLLYAHVFHILLFYARALIRGELPGDLENCEEIWNLIWGGMSRAAERAVPEDEQEVWA